MTETTVDQEVMAHREVEVRVKAMIDERIAPVVVALNDFPTLFTETSCEGFPPDGPGMISFRFGESWQEQAAFCLWLQDELGQRHEDGASVSLQCERHHHARGIMEVNWSAVERVAAELRAMAYRFTTATLHEVYAD